MSITRKIALAGCLALIANPVLASTWWVLKNDDMGKAWCERATLSPGQLYETLEGKSATILNQRDGGIEVDWSPDPNSRIRDGLDYYRSEIACRQASNAWGALK